MPHGCCWLIAAVLLLLLLTMLVVMLAGNPQRTLLCFTRLTDAPQAHFVQQLLNRQGEVLGGVQPGSTAAVASTAVQGRSRPTSSNAAVVDTAAALHDPPCMAMNLVLPRCCC